MSSAHDKQVAEIILQQLGGAMFLRFTGATNCMAHPFGENGSRGAVSFRLPGGGFAKDGINYVKITLTSRDTYDLTFSKVGRAPGYKVTEVATREDVYNFQLQDIFTAVTGLATHF